MKLEMKKFDFDKMLQDLNNDIMFHGFGFLGTYKMLKELDNPKETQAMAQRIATFSFGYLGSENYLTLLNYLSSRYGRHLVDSCMNDDWSYTLRCFKQSYNQYKNELQEVL